MNKKKLKSIYCQFMLLSAGFSFLFFFPKKTFAKNPLLTGMQKELYWFGRGGNWPAGFIETYKLPYYIGVIFKNFVAFMIIIFFAQMIWSGFNYITSKGNEQKVERAKDTIMSSIAGFIIAVAAYLITSYLLNQVMIAASFQGPIPSP